MRGVSRCHLGLKSRCGAILASLIMAGCAQIGESACFTQEWAASDYIPKMLASDRELAYADLTASERNNYLRAMNNAYPRTGLMYDRVGFFTHDKSMAVFVVHIKDGCVWHAYPMSKLGFFLVSQRGGT